MIKKSLALVVAGILTASVGFAGGKACCSGNMQTSNEKAHCMNLASLNLNADQQSKLMAWQDECMKAGCTKESRTAFFKKAKTILSKNQYAQLKSECDKNMTKKS
jgi:uncharacterized protein YycO